MDKVWYISLSTAFIYVGKSMGRKEWVANAGKAEFRARTPANSREYVYEYLYIYIREMDKILCMLVHHGAI